jgi:hypothetical protein
LGNLLPDQALLLSASGPLLAYVGAVVAFRGRGVRVLELELACLPSPVQLTVARLVIVLGYDVAVGGAMGLVLWLGGSEQVLILTLSWTMPLLLVAGLALVLSLRLAVAAATSAAYAAWLGTIAISTAAHLGAFSMVHGLLLVGVAGLAMLCVASVRMHSEMHRLLPQH